MLVARSQWREFDPEACNQWPDRDSRIIAGSDVRAPRDRPDEALEANSSLILPTFRAPAGANGMRI
jgi:hypothetical protein